MPDVDDVEKARELLASSEKLRNDLLVAAGKLDSYIEQLKAVLPGGEVDGAEVRRTRDAR